MCPAVGTAPGELRLERACPGTRSRPLVFDVVQARGDGKPLTAEQPGYPRA
jgi:hypothetical protein